MYKYPTLNTKQSKELISLIASNPILLRIVGPFSVEEGTGIVVQWEHQPQFHSRRTHWLEFVISKIPDKIKDFLSWAPDAGFGGLCKYLPSDFMLENESGIHPLHTLQRMVKEYHDALELANQKKEEKLAQILKH